MALAISRSRSNLARLKDALLAGRPGPSRWTRTSATSLPSSNTLTARPTTMRATWDAALTTWACSRS
eukprot:4434012-Pyramimonas_sp.AAC.1